MYFREVLEVGSRDSLTFKKRKKNAVRLVRQSPPYKDICFYIPRFLPFALGHLFFLSGGRSVLQNHRGREGFLRVHGSPIGRSQEPERGSGCKRGSEGREVELRGRRCLKKKKPNGIQTPVQLCAPGCDSGGGVAESCSSAGDVFPPPGSSLICRLRRRLRGGSGGGLAGASLLCHLHLCLLPCRCCGEGGGSFGGSTMAAAGRGDSSFKVDTCPCLREGEFPSWDAKAACSPSPPVRSWPETRTGRGSTPPHPPPAVAQ